MVVVATVGIILSVSSPLGGFKALLDLGGLGELALRLADPAVIVPGFSLHIR